MGRAALVLLTAAAAVLLAVVLHGPGPQPGKASSHREAPLISEDPTADDTDLYAFRSPDKPNTLTIIKNVIPGEDPAAGPNYYTFSPTARYNIYIDRNGDGRPDVTYRFRFRRKAGPAFLGDTAQPYTATKIVGGKATVVARASTPPNNVGPRTLKTLYKTTDYHSLVTKAIRNMKGGGLVFAGQREDPFFADIGAIFDFVAIRRGTGSTGGGKDFFAGYAVHSIAIQIPIKSIDTKSHAVRIWTSVDRRGVSVGGRVQKGWVQVSRLGNPLINEVIIPTNLKDLWNRLTPAQDKRFVKYYRTPLLAHVINQLYKLGAPEKNRGDLVQVLLTGIPKVNFTGKTLADELRVNLSVPVTEPSKFSRMGVLGGDNQGWPDGRRLSDDVIDIAEQTVGGFLKGKKLPLGDGVNGNDVQRMSTFPYVADPPEGFADAKGAQKP